MGNRLKQKAFLKTLSETGSVSTACRLAKIGRSTVYEWRDRSEHFHTLWDDAISCAAATLEVEARRRAIEGVEEPVFQNGQQCGAVRKYSDSLLMFLLKHSMPEKYRDRVDISGGDGLAPKIIIIPPQPKDTGA